ncbi:unnamed protein product [Caenorhabditis angaria]|uniref:Protein kinase domain-containing protein n=1 Tax=Caenorhabditis angaria TaxID=860376 RepID=A0A9P1MYS9_9PELO|nr:unnamed protein product [Caenorhabditis angaria]
MRIRTLYSVRSSSEKQAGEPAEKTTCRRTLGQPADKSFDEIVLVRHSGGCPKVRRQVISSRKMSDFEIAFNHFSKYPTLEVFLGFVTQVEMMALRLPANELKSDVIEAMTKIRSDKIFDRIRVNEAILRLYNVLGNVSQRLRITGIYEQIDKEGHFETSLKFHLQWAEGYGKDNKLEKFKYVLDLARERLKTKMTKKKIEAGFRDLVDSYFKDEADYLFLDPDDTMILFNPRHFGRANNRRRSSINILRKSCPIVDPAKKDFFGPKTKSLLRTEFLDNETKFGTSPEEFRVAMLTDLAGDCMDIEEQDDSVVIIENGVSSVKNEKRRRELSTIDEESKTSDISDSEKKSLIFSPDDDCIPLRNVNENPPATVTIFEEISIDEIEQDNDRLERGREGRRSCDSVTSTQLRRSNIGLNNLVENNHAGFSDTIVIEDTMIEEMESLDSTQNITTDCSVFSEPFSVVNSTAESSESLEQREQVSEAMDDFAPVQNVTSDFYLEPNFVYSIAEKSEARESFISNQQSIASSSKQRGEVFEPEEESENMESLASTQNVTADCSVYCYPDSTFVVHTNSGNSEVCTSDEQPEKVTEDMESLVSTQNATADSKVFRYPQHTFIVHTNSGNSKSLEQQDVVKSNGSVEEFDDSNSPSPKKSTKQCWDDSMDCAIRSSSVITSTPASHVPFVNVEEFFGNGPKWTKQQETSIFAFPDENETLESHSSVSPTFCQEPVAIEGTQIEEKINVKPDDSLSAQLERLSLGPEEKSNEIGESTPLLEVEETGRKDRRRSEVIRRENNPWDENLRSRIMKLVPTPTDQHEFEITCPRIVAMGSFEAGGETYQIQTLLGQGGYAKVYKAMSEEKKLVAVKYERPSCHWEVYVCDQLRFRLLQKTYERCKIIANQCIMQITDAYIFSNASLLINDYHEFGSLLDNINNLEDRNWHISCFLLVQIAKIIEKVHECGIIHGDLKPDNFMVTRKIDMSWEAEKLLGDDVFVVKLIDWGTAIDMSRLEGREFKGQAGTEGFDCPEMIDGRGWTYQPDFFGYAATMAVLISGKYGKVIRSECGKYSMDVEIKRRDKLREPAMEIIHQYLNIPSCSKLPKWSKAIEMFADIWKKNFDISEWRHAATIFNETCEKSKK